MPQGQVPQTYMDLLESVALGHLATVDAFGRPQVNPVWFLWDGEHVLVGVLGNAKKLENARRNPHVALSIVDPANPGRYLEVRGEVVRLELHRDLAFFNQLARKYTGADTAESVNGPARYKLTIRVESWTAQG